MENDRAVDLRFDTSSLISLFKNQASKSKPSLCPSSVSEKKAGTSTRHLSILIYKFKEVLPLLTAESGEFELAA